MACANLRTVINNAFPFASKFSHIFPVFAPILKTHRKKLIFVVYSVHRVIFHYGVAYTVHIVLVFFLLVHYTFYSIIRTFNQIQCTPFLYRHIYYYLQCIISNIPGLLVVVSKKVLKQS